MRNLVFRPNGHLLGKDDGQLVSYSDTVSHVFETVSRCGMCGERPEYYADDKTVTVRTPCPYPDGVTTVIRLEVPSGKLVVTDDLRPAYDWRDSDLTASYNSVLGQHQAVLAMAAQGCAYGPVGNTCPGLYRTGEDTYVIAIPDYDEKADAEILPESWTELAGIITDLWAYSIADYEDWQAKGGDNTGGWYRVVNVPPGTYEFTHHTGERGFDRDAPGTVVFADIRKVS